jgi:hypothetical protein
MSRVSESDKLQIGVDATRELSLRISVASLIKVLFNNPDDGNIMLALERTATLQKAQGKPDVMVMAKPFGGAVRLVNSQAFRQLIGDFHFDSKLSRQEGDFRIVTRPASWQTVQDMCWEHLKRPETGILDYKPERELCEEFGDTLHANITPDQYQLKKRGMIIEDYPVKTHNPRSPGSSTVRIYYIFEAWIEKPDLINRILDNHRSYTDRDLQELALLDAGKGRRGRANAILTLPLDALVEYYRSLPPNKRSRSIWFRKHQIAGNVLAFMNEVDQSRYNAYSAKSLYD